MASAQEREQALKCVQEAIAHANAYQNNWDEMGRKKMEMVVWGNLARVTSEAQAVFFIAQEGAIELAETYSQDEIFAALADRNSAMAGRYGETKDQMSRLASAYQGRHDINARWLETHAQRASDAYNAITEPLKQARDLLTDDSVSIPSLEKGQEVDLRDAMWSILDNIKRIQGWGAEKERSAESVAFANAQEEHYREDAQADPSTAEYSEAMAQTYADEREGAYEPQLDQHTRYNNDHHGQALAWIDIVLKNIGERSYTADDMLNFVKEDLQKQNEDE